MIFFLLLYGALKYVDCARPTHPRCLEVNRVAWRHMPPYTSKKNSTRDGIVEQIFFKAMDKCCIGKKDYSFTVNYSSQADIPNILMDENKKDQFEFVLPVQRDVKSKNYLIFPFVPLVVSPGIAVFINVRKKGAEAIVQSIQAMGPLMAIISILVGISGTLFWMLDTFTLVCQGEEPEHFLKGVQDGIWLAFVTMTTVGYGDRVPQTAPGRIFGVAWIIVGLTFCGILVSSITSGILVSITKTDIELMNEDVAVLTASEEFKYASKKQANVHELDTIEEIAEELRSSNVKIALIDTMVAGAYKELLQEFELNKIIETMNSNGVIFVNQGKKFSHCIRDYILDRQQEVLNMVSKSVETVEYKSNADDAVLIDPSLPFFRVGILSMLGTLLFFILCGVTKDWIVKKLKKRKRRNKKKKKEMKEVIDAFNDIAKTCDSFIEYLEKEDKKS